MRYVLENTLKQVSCALQIDLQSKNRTEVNTKADMIRSSFTALGAAGMPDKLRHVAALL